MLLEVADKVPNPELAPWIAIHLTMAVASACLVRAQPATRIAIVAFGGGWAVLVAAWFGGYALHGELGRAFLRELGPVHVLALMASATGPALAALLVRSRARVPAST
jgi:hypothetical protein